MTTPTTVNVRLQLRADTAANWTAANPILLANEVGLETDTKKLKVGDGSTAWASLAYFPSIVSGGTVLGNLEIGSTGTLTFEGSTADNFETTLGVINPTADRTINLPNVSGTIITTGDTGTVTSAMIADGAIVDADISGTAEISVSKLADGTARQLLQTDAAGTGVEWTSNVDVPGTLDVTSAATFDSNVTIAGDLTVNGTTTTINTQDLLVKDKNIEMGVVGTPSDTTANGGGITLKGTTDKTINWLDATDSWTSSENIDLASGKSYRIDDTEVLSGTTLGSGVVNSSLTSVGTIGTGTWQGTAIDDTYLDTISTAGKVSNSATTATDANTASAIVARDASGDFSAGTITADLTGNADTATALSSSRTFAVTGDVTGTVSSDLTAGASIATSIAAGVIVNDDINASAAIADTKLATISTAGKVSNSATTATNANTASAIVARDASGNFSAGTITADLTGNADTATALSSSRTFAVTGDVTGTVSSDLTSGASIATSIASGVIVDGDVNASAAIAGTKIAPDFGSQTIQTTGVINAGSGTEAAPSVSVGTTDNGLYSPGTDQVALSTNGTQRISIGSDGDINIDSGGVFYDATNNRLAIGTTSPGVALHVDGDIRADGIYGETDTNTSIQFPGSDVITFNEGGSEAARIDSSGRLLVGTPTSLQGNSLIQAHAGSGTNAIRVSSTLSDGESADFRAEAGSRLTSLGIYKHSGITNPCAYVNLVEEDGTNAYVWTDNSGNLRISSTVTHIGTTSGTVVGTQTSDERIKNILGPVEYGLEAVKQIEPVRYALKSEPDTEKLGFIAQQVQPLIPQSVFDTKEHIEGEPEDAPTKLGMEYVALIPVLVNAIKELSAEVDALKAQLKTQ